MLALAVTPETTRGGEEMGILKAQVPSTVVEESKAGEAAPDDCTS